MTAKAVKLLEVSNSKAFMSGILFEWPLIKTNSFLNHAIKRTALITMANAFAQILIK